MENDIEGQGHVDENFLVFIKIMIKKKPCGLKKFILKRNLLFNFNSVFLEPNYEIRLRKTREGTCILFLGDHGSISFT